MPLVDYFNRTLELADGQVLPVTHWLFRQTEVSGPELADRCVAGPDEDGRWWPMLLLHAPRRFDA